MDHDQMESLEVFDPVQKCHYRVLVPQEISNINENDNDEDPFIEEQRTQNFTTWSQTETLALINVYSLYKYRFKDCRRRKEQWNLISEELSKIGIQKASEKCEIKWKNLLRVYRQHKIGNKAGRGKFEFFNELNEVVSNDPQYKYLSEAATPSNIKTAKYNSFSEESQGRCEIEQTLSNKGSQKRKCSCEKSEKQKRHEDRMALMTKKMEIEERKVKAFEEYVQFLKSRSQNQ